MQVVEEKSVGKYLKKNSMLLSQYKKARGFLEQEAFDIILFKKKKAKKG